MFTRLSTVAIIALTGALATTTTANAASNPEGVWLNDTGRGAIEIKTCGKRLCGHVVWTKNTKDKKGCGKQIIGSVRKVGKRTWDRGWIYSPERGKKFSVELTPLKNNRLRVVGYAGSKFFSKTMVWKRAPDKLVRCDTGETLAEYRAKANGSEAVASTAKKAPAKTAKKAPAAKPAKRVAKKAKAKNDEPKLVGEPKIINRGGSSRNNGEDNYAEVPELPAENNGEEEYAARSDDTAEGDAAYRDEQDELQDDEYADQDQDFVSSGKELKIGNLKLDKVFRKTASGRCKLDLPWVKLDFRCDD